MAVGGLRCSVLNKKSAGVLEDAVADSERSGTGVDTVFRSCWPDFEALDAFLKPQVAMRESVTNLVRVSF